MEWIALSYVKMLQKIKKNQIPPVLFLYGSESFFINNLKSEIIKAVLSDEENLSTYDLEETPIEEVVEDAETYPFFEGKKLIFAINPTFLKAKPAKLPFEHDTKRLEKYINQPVDYSVIVLIASYEKIDNRKKITKEINKSAMVVECNPIKEHEVGTWIKSLADDLKITVAPEAYKLFEAENFVNLHIVASELNKLALYVGEGGTVTKEITEKLMSRTPSGSALRLVDAVIEHDIHKAISIYHELDKMNEEPIALLALLAYQFRMIFRVKLLKQKGYSQFQMRKQIGAHPYVIQIAYEREKKFTIQQLESIVNQLTVTDASIKRGEMDKNIAFELLLYHLIEQV